MEDIFLPEQMTDLISIGTLIQLAKQNGVDLGKGDPREHLSYLSKIGLLPPARRKRVGKKLEGHYPVEVVDKLEEVARWKRRGLSYPQMKRVSVSEPPVTHPDSSYLYLSFLITGLLIGYLFARVNVNSLSSQRTANLDPSVKIVSQLDQSNSQIYLISVPNSHLQTPDKIKLSND